MTNLINPDLGARKPEVCPVVVWFRDGRKYHSVKAGSLEEAKAYLATVWPNAILEAVFEVLL